jgi:hypothetical protein
MDLSKVSLETWETLRDSIALGQAVEDMDTNQLVSIAKQFADDLPFDSPVLALVDGLVERIKDLDDGTARHAAKEHLALAIQLQDVGLVLQADNERLRASIGRMRKRHKKRNKARLAYARGLQEEIAKRDHVLACVVSGMVEALKVAGATDEQIARAILAIENSLE